MTALRRVGVAFTKEQVDQIKALVKSGKTLDAQRLILKELKKEFGGSAVTFGNTMEGQFERLKQAVQGAERALAEALLPTIIEVGGKIRDFLNKPETIAGIKSIGKDLAGAFDKLLTIIPKLPWEQIKDAFKLMGQGAKAALDLFTSMPPWVQTAVLTGWGLNKLTGGALGGIVGELGKGLVKGVLGMTAGVVNIKAGAVTGIGGGGAVAGKGAGLASTVMKVALVGIAAGVAAELWSSFQDQEKANKAAGVALTQKTIDYTQQASLADMQNSLKGINEQTTALHNGLTPEAIAYQLNIGGVRDSIDNTKSVLEHKIAALVNQNETIGHLQSERLDAINATLAPKLDSVREAVQAQTHDSRPPVVNVSNTVTISGASVSRTVTITNRYGSPGGSYAGKKIPL